MHVALRVTLALLSATAPFAGALVAGEAPPIDLTLLDPARFDRSRRR